MLFDTHSHLHDEQFDACRDDVLRRAVEGDVSAIITVGTTAATSLAALELARSHPLVHAAVGLQPNECANATEDDWQRIVAMSGDEEVVALGETGLDRYWDFTPFEVQQRWFDQHLRLSQDVDLPFIVHLRDCEEEILVMLREARARGPLRGVMHSFTGRMDTAAECVELGLHVSFAGMVTFKKSHELREVAASIPADRLLIETDAPYLSPHPHRGRRPNEPALVRHTAACLAEVRGTTLEELAASTCQNARTLFRLPLPADS